MRTRKKSVGIETVLGAVLRYGVLLATFVILCGVAVFVAQGGLRAILLAPTGIPAGADADPRSLRVVLDDLITRRPAAITDLGLLLLIAIPVVNVIAAAITFAVERDWTYVRIATFVLAMLIVGFVLGAV
jgi:uncharacterized membrane protein